jgi:hypothetical protein
MAAAEATVAAATDLMSVAATMTAVRSGAETIILSMPPADTTLITQVRQVEDASCLKIANKYHSNKINIL